MEYSFIHTIIHSTICLRTRIRQPFTILIDYVNRAICRTSIYHDILNIAICLHQNAFHGLGKSLSMIEVYRYNTYLLHFFTNPKSLYILNTNLSHQLNRLRGKDGISLISKDAVSYSILDSNAN